MALQSNRESVDSRTRFNARQRRTYGGDVVVVEDDPARLARQRRHLADVRVRVEVPAVVVEADLRGTRGRDQRDQRRHRCRETADEGFVKTLPFVLTSVLDVCVGNTDETKASTFRGAPCVQKHEHTYTHIHTHVHTLTQCTPVQGARKRNEGEDMSSC